MTSNEDTKEAIDFLSCETGMAPEGRTLRWIYEAIRYAGTYPINTHPFYEKAKEYLSRKINRLP